MSAVTFSSDSRISAGETKKVSTSPRKVQQEKLDRIVQQAEAKGATPGAVTRLKNGDLAEAVAWLRGCCMFDLAREVEGVISGGVAVA